VKILVCDACGKSNGGLALSPELELLAGYFRNDGFIGPVKMDDLIFPGGAPDMCVECRKKLALILKARGWAKVEGIK
jgi:hypothetical protein